MIKNKDGKDLTIKSVTNIFDKEQEAKNMITKVKNQDKKMDDRKCRNETSRI